MRPNSDVGWAGGEEGDAVSLRGCQISATESEVEQSLEEG